EADPKRPAVGYGPWKTFQNSWKSIAGGNDEYQPNHQAIRTRNARWNRGPVVYDYVNSEPDGISVGYHQPEFTGSRRGWCAGGLWFAVGLPEAELARVPKLRCWRFSKLR